MQKYKKSAKSKYEKWEISRHFSFISFLSNKSFHWLQIENKLRETEKAVHLNLKDYKAKLSHIF